MRPSKRRRASASAGLRLLRCRQQAGAALRRWPLWRPAPMSKRAVSDRLRRGHVGPGPTGSWTPGGSGGAERVRDVLPRLAPRGGLRQMQDDAPDRALDPDRDLEQALAQDPDLRGPEG